MDSSCTIIISEHGFNFINIKTDVLGKINIFYLFVFFVWALLITGAIDFRYHLKQWKNRTNVSGHLKLPQPNVERDELQQMFAKSEISQLTQEQIQSASSGIATGVNVSMERLIKQYDTTAQKKFTAMHNIIHEVDKRADKLSKGNEELFAKCDQLSHDMGHLRTALEVAEA